MRIPKKVEQIKHWLDLLRLEHVILSDSHDGSFTFLLPIKNCPDINIALEKLRQYHIKKGDHVENYFPLKHFQYNKMFEYYNTLNSSQIKQIIKDISKK